MSNRTYLDYNATAPLRPAVRDLMLQVLEGVGNASSVHSFGRDARKYVEDARRQVAELVNVKPEQVIFNAGATEANNHALQGFKNKRVLISAIEHPSVFNSAPHAEKIPVTKEGVIDMGAFEKMLNTGAPPALVSVMLVNSETGVIQPVKEIATMARAKDAVVHTDAVQAAGRISLDMNDLGVDMLSLSAHKMAGPQGVGCLIIREGFTPEKHMQGGTHEDGRRGGTHNTAGIAGMGLAAQLAAENMPSYAEIKKLRDGMEAGLKKISNEVIIYGENAPRVGNTSSVGLPGVSAQTQLMALDLEGVATSSGSACSSGSWKASHVLSAMGVPEDETKCALRISLGWATTQADIDHCLSVWENMYKRTRKS